MQDTHIDLEEFSQILPNIVARFYVTPEKKVKGEPRSLVVSGVDGSTPISFRYDEESGSGQASQSFIAEVAGRIRYAYNKEKEDIKYGLSYIEGMIFEAFAELVEEAVCWRVQTEMIVYANWLPDGNIEFFMTALKDKTNERGETVKKLDTNRFHKCVVPALKMNVDFEVEKTHHIIAPLRIILEESGNFGISFDSGNFLYLEKFPHIQTNDNVLGFKVTRNNSDPIYYYAEDKEYLIDELAVWVFSEAMNQCKPFLHMARHIKQCWVSCIGNILCGKMMLPDAPIRECRGVVMATNDGDISIIGVNETPFSYYNGAKRAESYVDEDGNVVASVMPFNFIKFV